MALKGRKMTAEHRQKLKESRYKRFGSAVCLHCGEAFNKYTEVAEYCSKKTCKAARLRIRYEQEKLSDPIGSLARRMTGSIRLPNKKQVVKGMLEKAIGRPCEYCGVEINLKNASLDHKKPRHFGKVWDKKTRKRTYSYEEMLVLDAPSNLHIVCRPCNQLKSDMDDEQYRVFLEFIIDRPDIGKLLKKRLGFARGRWQHIFVKS